MAKIWRDTLVESLWGRIYMGFLFVGVLVTTLGAVNVAMAAASARGPMGQLIFGGGLILASLSGLVCVRAEQWRSDSSKVRPIRIASGIVFACLVFLFGFSWWVIVGLA